MKLNERVAIVTGAAQGLGRAYAIRLADEGARIVIADIGDGSGVRDEIAKKGGQAIMTHTDVSDEESVRAMARETIERFGRIDILVNNAGLFTTVAKKPFYDISVEEWDRVMSVNVKGTFLCSKAVYPQMKKQGKGKIINISSATFFMGAPNFGHYVASKGAVVGLTRAFAREVGDSGICVNAIAPGLTVSEIIRGNAKYPEEYLKLVASGRSIKRDETPDDLTGAVVFLASDDSDFLTGQTIVVDGGLIMY
ncbi:MAG: 3-oxoacyl-ACP reductase family protein [Syntrophorhabdales bacterium]|jgi:NAD(P)-dependent dehydrogenase (short-subunit alcohol dehydrogenase family)